MKCNEVEKQIDFFIDGELSRSPGDKVESHLTECASCRETFESLQAIRTVLRKDLFVSTLR